MSWVFNTRTGTRIKPFSISVYCSSLCSRTTCSGTGCFQGRIGTLPWNSRVYWSWHVFNRASWFASVFIVICRFQETSQSIITIIIKISLVRVQVILKHQHWLKSLFALPFFCQIDLSHLTGLNFKQNDWYIFILYLHLNFNSKEDVATTLKSFLKITQVNTRRTFACQLPSLL